MTKTPQASIRTEAGEPLVSRRWLLAGAATLLASPALAQGRTDQGATNILRQLAPQDRLGRIGGGGAPVRRPARRIVTVIIDHGGVRESVRLDLSRRIEITVFFDNDSTDLRTSAQRALFQLASALNNDILADQSFLVAGHTNAVGSRDYNLDLSAGRALAVRDWLTSVGGVPGNRLYTHGFGFDMLRNAANPASPVNRRVEIIGLDA
jgi:outer membrane protein OmpA-like peptidoglycan-associated protein